MCFLYILVKFFVICSLYKWLFNIKGANANEKIPKLIVLSFDGFRWDYIDKYETPTFDELAHEGVHAKFGMKGVFVSGTFPSHWTLATGNKCFNNFIIELFCYKTHL